MAEKHTSHGRAAFTFPGERISIVVRRTAHPRGARTGRARPPPARRRTSRRLLPAAAHAHQSPARCDRNVQPPPAGRVGLVTEVISNPPASLRRPHQELEREEPRALARMRSRRQLCHRLHRQHQHARGRQALPCGNRRPHRPRPLPPHRALHRREGLLLGLVPGETRGVRRLYTVGHARTIGLKPTQLQRKPLNEERLVVTGVLRISPRLARLICTAYGCGTPRSPRLIGARRFG